MCHLLTSAAAQLAERGPLSAFLTPFDGANLRDMKGRCCVSESRRGCLSEWLRARVQLAPAPTLRFSCGYRQKNKKKAEKDARCLLPDVLAPFRQGLSHSPTVRNFPSIAFFVVFSPDITRFPHLLHLCARALSLRVAAILLAVV